MDGGDGTQEWSRDPRGEHVTASKQGRIVKKRDCERDGGRERIRV